MRRKKLKPSEEPEPPPPSMHRPWRELIDVPDIDWTDPDKRYGGSRPGVSQKQDEKEDKK